MFKYDIKQNSKIGKCIVKVYRYGETPTFEANGAKLEIFKQSGKVYYGITVNGQKIAVEDVNGGSRRRRLLSKHRGGC